MAKAKIEFKKGDGITHYLSIPADSWTAGGTLAFTAKTIPDNDASDALAVINKEFSDSVVTDETRVINNISVPYKKYTMSFTAADLAGVTFADGSRRKKYLGEYQYTAPGEEPVSVPANDDFIETFVYADIRREAP